MNNVKIANKLRDIRKENKFTQEDLAKKVGVTRQTIICIEKGTCAPSIALSLKLSQVLGVCVDDIFTIVN